MTQQQPTTRPIILRAWEVRGLLDGTVTQLWRAMKRQPEHVWGSGVRLSDPDYFSVHVRYPGERQTDDIWVRCPWGKAGDRVWGRETWTRDIGQRGGTIVYMADGLEPMLAERWYSPVTMPRRYSRITLEVEAVSALPVQGVTEADALAGGIKKFLPPYPFPVDWPKNGQGKYTSAYGLNYASDRSRFARSAVEAFVRQWDQDNPRHPWGGNPQAWRLVVRRIKDSE